PADSPDLFDEAGRALPAADHENGEPVFVEPMAAPQRLSLARRGGAEPQAHRKAERLELAGRDVVPAALAKGAFRRDRDHVSARERPPAVELDQVGDDDHQAARTAGAPDGLPAHVVDQRMYR